MLWLCQEFRRSAVHMSISQVDWGEIHRERGVCLQGFEVLELGIDPVEFHDGEKFEGVPRRPQR